MIIGGGMMKKKRTYTEKFADAAWEETADLEDAYLEDQLEIDEECRRITARYTDLHFE